MRHSAHSGHIYDHTRLLPKPRAYRNGAATHFHRFSMAAWMIQLIPYFMGMLTGIPMIDLSANEAFYPSTHRGEHDQLDSLPARKCAVDTFEQTLHRRYSSKHRLKRKNDHQTHERERRPRMIARVRWTSKPRLHT